MVKVIGINHVTISVKDKQIAKDFYVGILELKDILVAKKHLWIKVGHQYIHLSGNPTSTDPSSFSHFAIIVDDYTDYVSKLKKKRVQLFELANNNVETLLENPANSTHCFLRDPDSNLLEIVDSKSLFFNPNTDDAK